MGMKPRQKRTRIPCIITVGEPGRAVVFGWADKLPEPDTACELHDARMVLRWEGTGGLFGLSQHGPAAGSRITCAVPVVRQVARQVLSVSDAAAKSLAEWPNA